MQALKNLTMHFLFLTFGCSRDEGLATLSLESVERAMQNSPLSGSISHSHIVAYDQGDLLSSRAIERYKSAASGNLKLDYTSFPRGGTLDGVDCVVGQVLYYQQLFKDNPKATHIVKKDSDVLMRGTRFLLDIAESAYDTYGAGITKKIMRPEGWAPLYPFFAGMCYTVSRKAIESIAKGGEEAIRDALVSVDRDSGGYLSFQRDRGPRWPEDECVYWLLRKSGAAKNGRLMPMGEDPAGYIYRWDYSNGGLYPTDEQAEGLRVFDLIDFGKTCALAPDFPERKDRLLVAQAGMRRCLDLM